jgi:competence protein ComEA
MKFLRIDKKFLYAAVIFGAIMAALLASCRQEEPVPIQIIPPAPSPTAAPTMTPAPMLVYVSGEVVMPDVYELAPNDRIKQLIEAAGGFTTKADPAAVNLAQRLTDGAHVHVPAKGEMSTAPAVFSAPVLQQNPDEVETGAGGNLVNINSANQSELETLPGIGPKTAQKILAYRAVNGPFTDIEAIMEVSGIGQARFDQIKQLITTTE